METVFGRFEFFDCCIVLIRLLRLLKCPLSAGRATITAVGPNDSWNKPDSTLTFKSREQVDTLLSGLEMIHSRKRTRTEKLRWVNPNIGTHSSSSPAGRTNRAPTVTTERATELSIAAARILNHLGSSIAEAQRTVNGQSNLVWLTENLVLRMAAAPGGDSLLRETALAELLPREIGYPEVLASGVEDGHEWIASRRLPGSNLAEAWQSLSGPAQNRAVLGLWDRLEAVHRTDIRAALAIGCDRTPLYELERAGATYQLHAAVAAGVLRIDDEIRLAAILDVAFDAIRLHRTVPLPYGRRTAEFPLGRIEHHSSRF